MHARREQNTIILAFSFFESQVLRQILRFIGETYSQKPSELDPQAAAAWYSTRGCETAGMSAEEVQDWLNQVHDYRSARVALINRCVQALRPRELAEPMELRVSLEEASDLITILNDHRLLAAARNDIGQKEMDLNNMADFNALPAPQQTALTEIHVLAYMIESLLQLLSREESAEPEG